MTKIEIYTDGSSKHNGKENCIAGWAMVIPNFRGKMFIRYGQLPAPSSNNKGEIMGVLYALSLFANQDVFQPVIYSDSQYVVNTGTIWREKRLLTDFDGTKNKATLKPLCELMQGNKCNAKLIWVKGHAGLHGNELADEFCAYGREAIIRDKVDEISDIRYVHHEKLPYDLTAP